MIEHYITHTRPDNYDTDRRIQGFLIGGVYWTIDQVIAALRVGHRFFVGSAFRRIEVREYIHPRSRRAYVKTDADGIEPNNLLALPAC